MINLTFNIGRDDLIAFSQAFHDHSPSVKSAVRRAQLTLPAIMAVAAAYFYFTYGGLSFVFFLCVGLLWFFFYPAYLRRNILKATERMLKETSYQKSFGSYSVTLDDDGIASISPTGESKYKWSAVSRIQLTPDYLHIYLTGPVGYPIPRKQIGEDKIQEAKLFVESKMRT
jgi:hypothetical protein